VEVFKRDDLCYNSIATSSEHDLTEHKAVAVTRVQEREILFLPYQANKKPDEGEDLLPGINQYAGETQSLQSFFF